MITSILGWEFLENYFSNFCNKVFFFSLKKYKRVLGWPFGLEYKISIFFLG